MWLLGSPSQLMMMDERLSPSARSVQSPGTPSTIHSIEAILGFKEDIIFHKSASYSMTDKVLGKDPECNGNVIVTPTKNYAESFDSKSSKSGRFNCKFNTSHAELHYCFY